MDLANDEEARREWCTVIAAKDRDLRASLIGTNAGAAAATPPHKPRRGTRPASTATIHEAAADGDTARVEELLARFFFGARVDAKDEIGGTPLHAAARGGHAGTAKAPMSMGANVEAKTANRLVQLLDASKDPVGTMAEILVKGGGAAGVAAMHGGHTPLHFASQFLFYFWARDSRCSELRSAAAVRSEADVAGGCGPVVGRWTKGAPGLKMCPVLPGGQFKRHDSLVDNVANPFIFVVPRPGTPSVLDHLPLTQLIDHHGSIGSWTPKLTRTQCRFPTSTWERFKFMFYFPDSGTTGCRASQACRTRHLDFSTSTSRTSLWAKGHSNKGSAFTACVGVGCLCLTLLVRAVHRWRTQRQKKTQKKKSTRSPPCSP